jgi:hypothetical protein
MSKSIIWPKMIRPFQIRPKEAPPEFDMYNGAERKNLCNYFLINFLEMYTNVSLAIFMHHNSGLLDRKRLIKIGIFGAKAEAEMDKNVQPRSIVKWSQTIVTRPQLGHCLQWQILSAIVYSNVRHSSTKEATNSPA